MKRLAAVALVFMLAACAGDALTRTTTGLAFACKQIGSMYSELAVYNDFGALSASEISTVDNMQLVTIPLCKKDAVIFDLDAALAAVERQLVIASALQRKKDLEGK